MKHMKRAAALFLALIMIMSLAVTAFAAEVTKPAAITIKGTASTPITGRTFKVYKAMDATLKDPTDPAKGVAYYVPKSPVDLSDFYAARYTMDKTIATFDEDVADAIAGESDMFAFGADLLAFYNDQNASATGTAVAETLTINNLDYGYYVIQDTGAKKPISAVMLDTAYDGTGKEITIKAETPSVDKQIDLTAPAKANNAAIGDEVPFVITSKVPDMTGYKNYFFYVEDNLSTGLTFVNDTGKYSVSVGGTTLTAVTDYEVKVTGQKVEFVLKDFYNKYNGQSFLGKPIEIKYCATVNENAVIGTEGNKNTVKLHYSNDPSVSTDGDYPEGDENNVVGVTPDSVTKTYVTGLEITKIDNTNNRLTGAEFELKGEKLNKVVKATDVFTEDAEGTWYALKDGTYTEDTSGKDEDYVSKEVTYKKETKKEILTKTEDYKVTGIVGDDGVLRFDGLAAGDYILTELKAPDGYNKLREPLTIKVAWQAPADGDLSQPCTWTVTGATTSVNNGVVTINVQNQAGSVLPETGGMGTTMFFVIGSMLVMASAVLLIADKRRKQF